MKCTTCGKELKEVTVDAITVDVCRGGCGGIWFDAFELRKVDERHESAGESLLDRNGNRPMPVDPNRKRMCPRCESMPMMRHFYSIKQQVAVDECPSCGGFWLDAGELAHIRETSMSDEERWKAVDAYFEEIFGKDLARLRGESRENLKKARKIAQIFRFLCPSYYIPGKQEWGAF